MVVAVDAVVNHGNVDRQPRAMLRDINKLYVGLKDPYTGTAVDETEGRPIFATGHWGCGAFGGDKHLKAIQQLIAASVAGVDLHYYAFGDRSFSVWFPRICALLKKHNLTVGDVFKTLERLPKDCGVFAWFEEEYDEEEHPPTTQPEPTAEPKS
jgi:poly(ADP-ribose) glycohydrolase